MLTEPDHRSAVGTPDGPSHDALVAPAASSTATAGERRPRLAPLAAGLLAVAMLVAGCTSETSDDTTDTTASDASTDTQTADADDTGAPPDTRAGDTLGGDQSSDAPPSDTVALDTDTRAPDTSSSDTTSSDTASDTVIPPADETLVHEGVVTDLQPARNGEDVLYITGGSWSTVGGTASILDTATGQNRDLGFDSYTGTWIEPGHAAADHFFYYADIDFSSHGRLIHASQSGVEPLTADGWWPCVRVLDDGSALYVDVPPGSFDNDPTTPTWLVKGTMKVRAPDGTQLLASDGIAQSACDPENGYTPMNGALSPDHGTIAWFDYSFYDPDPDSFPSAIDLKLVDVDTGDSTHVASYFNPPSTRVRFTSDGAYLVYMTDQEREVGVVPVADPSSAYLFPQRTWDGRWFELVGDTQVLYQGTPEGATESSLWLGDLTTGDSTKLGDAAGGSVLGVAPSGDSVYLRRDRRLVRMSLSDGSTVDIGAEPYWDSQGNRAFEVLSDGRVLFATGSSDAGFELKLFDPARSASGPIVLSTEYRPLHWFSYVMLFEVSADETHAFWMRRDASADRWDIVRTDLETGATDIVSQHVNRFEYVPATDRIVLVHGDMEGQPQPGDGLYLMDAP